MADEMFYIDGGYDEPSTNDQRLIEMREVIRYSGSRSDVHDTIAKLGLSRDHVGKRNEWYTIN